MNNDDDDDILLEVTYFGDRLVNIPNVPFRLIIHSSVTEIDNAACWGCTTLTEVVFHENNNVTQIGRRAFKSCRNLQHIELPAEGLLRVEDDAFYGCTSLRGDIVIPATVQYMGSRIFVRCTSLESVVFVPTTASIELGSCMFHACFVLRFVTLPPNLQLIPRGCFEDCTSLTHLHIPESVEEIEEDAFDGSDLRSIHIPEKVHRIGFRAFGSCLSLQKVTIHSSSHPFTMATDIFFNCPALSVIKMYPYLWPTLFASMKGQPDFIIQFFRLYHTQIFDF